MRLDKFLFCAFLMALFLLASHSRSLAQVTGDYRSVAAGNWNDRTRWQRFNNPGWATPTALQGYPGQLAGSANARVTVQNNITLNVTPLFGIGDLDVTNEVTLNTAGNPNLTIVRNLHIINLGLFEPAFCTFGNGTLTIGAALTVDLLCTLTFGTGTLSVSGATSVGIAGNITNNGNFTTPSTVSLASFIFDGTFTNNGTATLSNTGAAVLNGAGTWTQGVNSILNYAGSTLTVNTLNASNTGNLVNYNRNGVQTLDNPSANTYHHLTLAVSNTKTSSGNLNINGNLTISGTAQLDVNSGNDDINIAGNWNVTSTNANPFVEGTRTVNFDGAGAQTITTVLAAGETFYNLTLSGGGVKSSANVIDINGNLLISGTSQFNVNNNISVAGNWTVTSTNADPFVQGTRTVTLNGTTSQTLTTVLAAGETFYNLIINNTFATSPQLILNANDPVTVSSILTMTDGNINLNGNTFTISSNAAGALSHALSSANGWMYGGNIVRSFPVAAVAVGNVAGFYPLGGAADFRPFFVGKTAGATTTGTITMSHINATTTTALAPPIPDGASTITLRHDAFWDCSSATMTTGTFEIIAGGTGFGTIGSINDLRLTPPAAPVVGTAGVNSNTTTDPRVRRNALTRAQLLGNNFHIGSVDPINSPLPIELIDFSAKLNSNVVELNWSTATEIDNDFFTIERATDLEHFEAIIIEDGKGTSKEENKYKRMDPSPAFGRSYYRLKQTDFDGKFTYSNLEVIDYEGPRFATLTAYPNPFKGSSLMIKVEGLKETTDLHVQIINIQGQKVFDKILDVKTSGSITEEILSDTILPAGLYIIKAGETLQLTQKIVVE